jgi:fatty acid desaturase
MADSPAAAPAREKLATVLATQLHRDRRSLLRGTFAFAAVNLSAAVIVWLVPGGPLAWATVGAAFLGSVFFSLTVDWEFSRLTLWRREIGRLGVDDAEARALGDLLTDRRTARPGRAVKWINWAITVVWLIALLALVARRGVDWTGFL